MDTYRTNDPRFKRIEERLTSMNSLLESIEKKQKAKKGVFESVSDGFVGCFKAIFSDKVFNFGTFLIVMAIVGGFGGTTMFDNCNAVSDEEVANTQRYEHACESNGMIYIDEVQSYNRRLERSNHQVICLGNNSEVLYIDLQSPENTKLIRTENQ